jgi:Domain of unknown function (DUF4149)
MSVGILNKLTISFASIWFGISFFINFFAVRLLFSEIDQFFLAGKIGMAIFSKFNSIELVLSSLILSLISFVIRKTKTQKWLLIISIVLWILTLFYHFYLTPKIIELTHLWYEADLMGLSSVRGIPDIQQEHQFFHHLYITCDSFKLIFLLVFICTLTFKNFDELKE